MRLPPPGDQEEFYNALLQNARTEPESAVIMLLWRTGMHASTLCSTKFIIDEPGHIVWRRPKTGKPLSAALPDNEIRTILRCRDAGSLPTAQRTLRRWVERVGDRAGIAGCCPLMLRHSRTIWLRQRGFRLEEVAQLMGCSVQVVVKYYALLRADGLADKAARLVQ